jgi:hypothetical protein
MIITLFFTIIRLHSKGLEGSWGDVNTTNKTLFDVFNKTLTNPNERLPF